MSIHLTEASRSFLSTHHSVISSQIETRAAIFMLTSVMLTTNWRFLVSIYYSVASNSTSVIWKHRILPTTTSRTLAPALINTSHLLCCMPVVSGTII